MVLSGCRYVYNKDIIAGTLLQILNVLQILNENNVLKYYGYFRKIMSDNLHTFTESNSSTH